MKRMITMSIMLPATVQLLVERSDDNEEEENNQTPAIWDVVRVIRADANPSVREIMERMSDEETDEMDRLASAAKNIP